MHRCMGTTTVVFLVCVLCDAENLTRESPISKSPPTTIVPIPSHSDHVRTNLTEFSISNGIRGYLVRSPALSLIVDAPCILEDGTYDADCHERLERVSKQSGNHQCHVAVNGGPFGMHGTLIGGVVMRGRVVHGFSDGGDVGFGWTRSNEWVLGLVNNMSTAIDSLGLLEFVTGFEWLVYEGDPVATYINPTGAERAPRTAVGVDSDGQLMMLILDGCEKCLRNRGVTLKELANLFAAQGVRHAINLDGGSSTALVVDGKVRNQPTCLDIAFTCERPVATILCLKSYTNGSVEDLG